MAGYCKYTSAVSANWTNQCSYVGAEDGIHEFHVNTASRKVFPSLVLQ